jgi:DNA-binding response OmpR family regulator
MASRYRYRILYVGHDLALLSSLQAALKDCHVVRCPRGTEARSFIEGIDYSLLIFDDELSDMTGAELEQFTRAIKYREKTPILIYKPSDDYSLVVDTITRLPGA